MIQRKRKQTEYRKRLSMLKSGLPRIVVRKTRNVVIGQIIEYRETGDITTGSAYGSDLKKYGWEFSLKNIPAAYLTGFLLAKKSGAKEAILDKGSRTLKKDSFVYYLLKGAKDGGMNVHADELPISEERLYGSHISSYYDKRTGNQFSSTNEKVKNIKEEINRVMERIKQDGK
ncbi:MAG: 50S ribosomal protein L18 [Candidatus Parvarchaeota archaeon]|nr:50S ribosomal protein L18 [Candidatus Parvarchaeota archaeon]